ncbi:hypothetical protein [Anaerosporobacter faecicola]|uniref:hypothetical protein n=1 Tax=Anaerosporobacter faecicola TaxID=2718714 RepID=UPI00143A84FB|nr:hypothetical protein [Anaerosporobacter faecicola]
MGAYSIAILDMDREYLSALANYIQINAVHIREVQAFTDKTLFLEHIKNNTISYLLVEESIYPEILEIKEKEDYTIYILTNMPDCEYEHSIHKYQSAKDIVALLEEKLIRSTSKAMESNGIQNKSQLISVLTPFGGVGTTIVTMRFAQALAKEKKVIVVNLNPFDTMEKLLEINGEEGIGLSELLYYYRQEHTDTQRKQLTFMQIANVHYVKKVQHYTDLLSMRKEDLTRFYEEVKSRYGDVVIVILVRIMNECTEVLLKSSSQIYMESSWEEPLDEQNKILLTMLEQKEIVRKEQIIKLPYLDISRLDRKSIKEMVRQEENLDLFTTPWMNPYTSG